MKHSLLLRATSAVMAALSIAAPVPAHHSFAMFDAQKTVVTKATVKQFQWGNPHTWLELLVIADDGTQSALSLELNGISGLVRNGWKPSTLSVGDQVTVTYHPMRNGSAAGELVEAVVPDGRTLSGR